MNATPRSGIPARTLKAVLPPQRIRFVPDISAECLRCRHTNELSLWYCLRAINRSGSGTLDLRLALQTLTGTFGYTKRTVYRQLSGGHDIFWTIISQNTASRIYIHGISTVARLLQVRPTQKYFREVLTERFNTASKRRAEVYASVFKPWGVRANPISRASIKAITGVTKSRQRRYEAVAGIKRTPNYAMTFSGTGADHRVEPETMVVKGKSREYVVPKRLGNTYHSGQTQGCQGQLKGLPSASKAVRSSESGEARTSPSRRFFKSHKRLVGELSKRGDVAEHQGYYLLNNAYRSRKGRMEWCSYSAFNLE